MTICLIIAFLSSAVVCFAHGKITAQGRSQRKWTLFFDTGAIRRM